MIYMKRFGISIHEAASFVIAQRSMGFKEKLPPVLDALLQIFDVDKFHRTGELFAPGTLTNLEQKSLSKLRSGKTAV